MKKLKVFSIVSFAVVLMGGVAMTGCKKGDTGATGAAGATGATGATGASGTDSVLYSSWTPFAMDSSATYQDWEQSIDAAGLTQNILDNGVILMYLSDGQGSVVDLQSYMTAIFSVGNIYLIAGSSWDGAAYRYVLIPGGIATSSSTATRTISGYTVDQLKKMSYSNVSKLFAIPTTGSGKLKATVN